MASEHESSLDSTYNVLRLGVASGNKIANRTSQVVKHLLQPAGEKKAITSLRAKAPVANKLISAVEIAKRDLAQNGHKVYQYSVLSMETVTVREKQPVSKYGQQTRSDGGSEEEEEDAFEVMGEKEKTQQMPVLNIYLSLVSIKELRLVHG